MQVFDIAAAALRGPTARLRRAAILYAIATVCGLAVLVLATGAAVLALEPHIGSVHALLVVAGVFATVLMAVVVMLSTGGRKPAPVATAAPEPAQRKLQVAQIAMIIEAVMLGHALSRRSNR